MTVKPILLGVLTTLLLAGPVLANQDMNVDEKVKAMQRDLVLTDAQAASVKQIMNDFKDKVNQAHKEKEQRMSQVLTPEQMNKMKDMKKAWDKD